MNRGLLFFSLKRVSAWVLTYGHAPAARISKVCFLQSSCSLLCHGRRWCLLAFPLRNLADRNNFRTSNSYETVAERHFFAHAVVCAPALCADCADSSEKSSRKTSKISNIRPRKRYAAVRYMLSVHACKSPLHPLAFTGLLAQTISVSGDYLSWSLRAKGL